MAKSLVFDSFAPNLGAKDFFSYILLLQDVRICCKLSLYAISRKTNESNLRKWQETLFWAPTIVFVYLTSSRCFASYHCMKF